MKISEVYVVVFGVVSVSGDIRTTTQRVFEEIFLSKEEAQKSIDLFSLTSIEQDFKFVICPLEEHMQDICDDEYKSGYDAGVTEIL